jgi:tetratricopeptide (TPR) repeat protein
VLVAVVCMAVLCARSARAVEGPAAPLEQALAAAEKDLRDGELQSAESHYRTALLEAWMLMGGLEAGDGRLAEARVAFRRAAHSAVETRRPLQSLALVHLQMGEAPEAVAILTRLATRAPKDAQTRRLLAQALVAGGQPAEAVQELEEAHALDPADLEMTFTLASGYLRVGKRGDAARLFAEVVRGRPIPQTRVLIGRTYRDFGMYDEARVELNAALEQDPRVRRAHYYLGMIGVVEEGTSKLEEAITEFREELKLAPTDPVTNLRLGMALVEAQRNAEALPHLELAARSDPPSPDAYHYLGRCHLGLDRTPEAVAALRKALELSQGPVVDEMRVGGIHYLLGVALRKQGAAADAAVHFAEAEKNSAQRTTGSREYLARYLADLPNTDSVVAALPSVLEASPLAGLAPAARRDLRGRAKAALARAYLNLGVMHAQAERFSRAADEFERAAEVDPDFPQVQYSLGVAQFNARRFDKATAPLARVLAGSPDDAGVKRMLAMAWLNTDAYDKAAALLATDPERGADPSLEYAYGLALVRSGRAAEAEAVFSRLLARHGGSPELNVVLAQAHAQQDDYQSAIDLLQRAIAQKGDVAEAQATLGFIYLRQGKLAEAEEALRAELRGHPDDLRARHHLATVLDLAGRPDEALPLLRGVLKARADFADARYLLGKILLGQGQAVEAAEHLEAALRVAPEDANIHYQLGQAYQKLGRPEQAQERFESFQKLKDKRRGSLP